MNERDFQTHVKVLGWLYICSSLLLLAIAGIGFFFMAGLGVATADAAGMRFFAVMALTVGAMMLVLALPGLVAGYGLVTARPWGRIAGLVIGILALIMFPIGTLLGVYALFVLMQQRAEAYFRSSEPPRAEDVEEAAFEPE
jgi:ABC-type Fe3+ transport system permease subunit